MTTATGRTADVVLVGAGIVGLATAWQLVQARPDLVVHVVDKEDGPARHQSSHNSGVLHAGIYYPPGSLKATLCRRGKAMLEAYASDRGIDIAQNGKLVIATSDDQVPGLRALADRAHANGVPDLAMLDSAALRTIEPAATGVAALHSPRTGVVDFGQVCHALVDDLDRAGASVRFGAAVEAVDSAGDHAEVHLHGGQTLRARTVVVCAGLQSDRLAPDRTSRVVPFRGTWYRLADRVAAAVRGSIYPVPDSRFPFLGVHVTRRIDDQVVAGPNAFVALARETYRRSALNWRDAWEVASFGGFWLFAARHLGAAATELRHEVAPGTYARAVAAYLPDVTVDDLERGPVGIRAQAMTPGGGLLDDFAFTDDGRVLHVRNAPSPGATASLAIGEHIARRLLAHQLAAG